MADIKIIIKISENTYRRIQALVRDDYFEHDICGYSMQRIADGTPLSKEHGRLGDLDKIKKEMQNYHDDCAKTSEYTRLGFETAMWVVEDAKTIIEADKENKE